MNGSLVLANTTPEVPRVRATTPCVTAPTPTACAAWSPPPATMGVPAGSPVAAAAWALRRPVISGPSNKGGSHSGGISSASSTAGDQARWRRSISTVPEPSALSMPYSPLNL